MDMITSNQLEKITNAQFELVYGRTATLPVEREINTYLAEPITEENFQKTLLRRTYDLMETLENKQLRAANNIQKSQEKQKERHDNQLPDKPVEFKIGDKDGPFYIKEILGNRAYKLRLNNKILTKAPYCDITLPSTSNIPQLGVQRILTLQLRTPKKTKDMVDKIMAKNLYMDKTKQLFDKRILQQLEHFVGKNNLSTQARAIYRIHTAFQDKPEILLNKAMDIITSNQLGKITNA
ncbi:hypothetical protein G9A89_006531 [Geosiphon pyriformis]|nr:hypothetical protein G9A89_006531 [Geosiphon pyriformis]